MDSVAMIHYSNNNNNYYYPTYQHQLLAAKDLALSASPTSVTEIDELLSSGKANQHNHHYSIASAITSTPSSIESVASYSPSLSLSDYRSMDEADQIVPDCTTIANNNTKMTNNRHYLYHHLHNHHHSTNPSISPNSVWSMVHEVFKIFNISANVFVYSVKNETFICWMINKIKNAKTIIICFLANFFEKIDKWLHLKAKKGVWAEVFNRTQTEYNLVRLEKQLNFPLKYILIITFSLE